MVMVAVAYSPSMRARVVMAVPVGCSSVTVGMGVRATTGSFSISIPATVGTAEMAVTLACWVGGKAATAARVVGAGAAAAAMVAMAAMSARCPRSVQAATAASVVRAARATADLGAPRPVVVKRVVLAVQVGMAAQAGWCLGPVAPPETVAMAVMEAAAAPVPMAQAKTLREPPARTVTTVVMAGAGVLGALVVTRVSADSCSCSRQRAHRVPVAMAVKAGMQALVAMAAGEGTGMREHLTVGPAGMVVNRGWPEAAVPAALVETAAPMEVRVRRERLSAPLATAVLVGPGTRTPRRAAPAEMVALVATAARAVTVATAESVVLGPPAQQELAVRLRVRVGQRAAPGALAAMAAPVELAGRPRAMAATEVPAVEALLVGRVALVLMVPAVRPQARPVELAGMVPAAERAVRGARVAMPVRREALVPLE